MSIGGQAYLKGRGEDPREIRSSLTGAGATSLWYCHVYFSRFLCENSQLFNILAALLVFYCCSNELPHAWWPETVCYSSGGQKSEISLLGQDQGVGLAAFSGGSMEESCLLALSSFSNHLWWVAPSSHHSDFFSTHISLCSLLSLFPLLRT